MSYKTKASISAQVRAFVQKTQNEIEQEHPGLPEDWVRQIINLKLKHWIAKQDWDVLVNCEVKAPKPARAFQFKDSWKGPRK